MESLLGLLFWRELLKAGAQVDRVSEPEDMTGLMLAAEAGYKEVAKILLEYHGGFDFRSIRAAVTLLTHRAMCSFDWTLTVRLKPHPLLQQISIN